MRKKYFLILCITFFMARITFGQGTSKIQFRDSVVISLWDNNPPFAQQTEPEKYLPSRGDNVRRVTNISNPTLIIYQFKDSINTQRQPAVVICPGGGYDYLVMNKEGTEIASRLVRSGIRPIVLKYRVPKNRQGAYADAQRAISILRSRADEFSIDPERIGILGFSAGGSLSARMCTHFEQRVYDARDQYDKADMRPDFGILVYPFLVNQKNEVLEDVQVGDNTPPMFIVQTEDDPIGYRHGLFFYNALCQHKIPAELHLFAHGGHGYGIRVDDATPLSQWLDLCIKWLRSIDVIR